MTLCRLLCLSLIMFVAYNVCRLLSLSHMMFVRCRRMFVALPYDVGVYGMTFFATPMTIKFIE